LGHGKLTTDEPDRRISWESETGTVRRGEFTFAPLEGGATWLVLSVELESLESLESDSRWIDRELQEVRDSLEERYFTTSRESRR
jgi:uncharacterized membrane protein